MTTDIIVVGGGHAGIEAAAIGSKMGAQVLLVTSHLDLIGQMSCNPAIGGIAKGNIVREIDALGGIMGQITDTAGIQFRMLNRSKGAAVWGNRAQADKRRYREECRRKLESLPNLTLYQAMVTGLCISHGRVSGVTTEAGEEISAGAVVLACGTFLNGLGHIGSNSFPCGRNGEPPSKGLSEAVQSLGISAGRLKTGTPARIDGRTVETGKLAVQEGDSDPWPFSYGTINPPKNRAVCWTVKTTPLTHRIILDNIHKSALFGGRIKGIGPRYCPSIEDKLVRFGERDGHTLFLEPEGLDTSEMYLNGFSTSLPVEIQISMVRSLPGFGSARIIRPAYAIEYDYFHPTQLLATLESRVVENLYFAGQINGTSGYEEAACQGLVAGINAAAKLRGGEPFILGRETSYTAVLIDDLITKGTEEPYRMFTSRAEHRLCLRQDSADERLMPLAAKRGLIEPGILDRRKRVWERKAVLREKLRRARVKPGSWAAPGGEELPQQVPAIELLRRPEVRIQDLKSILDEKESDREVLLGVEADIKYEGFVEKQQGEIERARSLDDARIPNDIQYDQIGGLLNESRAKLKMIRPQTLGQASRISGVTPADVSLLIMHIAAHNKTMFHVKR
jgi:tRNA uridine 5-carboxymethylaminomethyl modification enzyme